MRKVVHSSLQNFRCKFPDYLLCLQAWIKEFKKEELFHRRRSTAPWDHSDQAGGGDGCIVCTLTTIRRLAIHCMCGC